MNHEHGGEPNKMEEPCQCICGESVELNAMNQCEWCEKLICKECTRHSQSYEEDPYAGQTICEDCSESRK